MNRFHRKPTGCAPPDSTVPSLTVRLACLNHGATSSGKLLLTRIAFSVMALPVLLAACAPSIQLPQWPSPALSTSGSTPGVVVSTLPSPTDAVSGVQVTPVSPQTPIPAPISAPTPQSSAAVAAAQSEQLPYSAAVAARFPAPTVVYSTPGLQTGRTSFTTQVEVRTWLREQVSAASRTPGIKATVLQIGQSQRGEAIEALVLARAASTEASSLRTNGKPTVMLVGQQHGDEPAGSEALLVIARELSQGLLRTTLDRINVVIVPRANPDGAASSQRLTAGGTDMDHDHLLLSTPETQALARLARDYQPVVVVDSQEYTVIGHYLEKFGTLQKYDALLQYATTANLPEFLTKAAEEWYRRPLLSALRGQGLTTEWYYTTSTDMADKKVSMGGVLPDTGRNVSGLKNEISLLVETRGVGLGRVHLQRRVHTQVTALSSVLASTAQRAAELNQLRPYLDKEVAAQACKSESVVEAAATLVQYDLTMLDPTTGADRILSVDWDSSLALRAVKSRLRPCGYWLSEASGTAVDRLRLQGVLVQRVAEPGALLGDSYREISRTTGERTDVRGTTEGGVPAIKVQVSLTRGLVDIPRGSFYITLNQPLGNLVFAALEPDTQSSFFANQVLGSLQSTVRVMGEPNLRFEELQ